MDAEARATDGPAEGLDATDDLGQIHDRLPMLVQPGSWEQWLDPGTHPKTLTSLPSPAVTAEVSR